jgi:dihydroxyacetone kinase-like predicted kinase
LDVIGSAYQGIKEKNENSNNFIEILEHGITNAEIALENTKYLIEKNTGNKVHDAG